MNSPFRPTTPHRRSRSLSNGSNHAIVKDDDSPIDAIMLQAAPGSYAKPLEELHDAVATLDANMSHLQAVHDSLSQFNEGFSSLLYGLRMNSWCVEFSERPSAESFARDRTPINLDEPETDAPGAGTDTGVGDITYMTNDNQSFISSPMPPPRKIPRRPGAQSGIPRPQSRVPRGRTK
uniref:DASH complex subunit DAM1 n=1 Tax=Blastobotrys adeninivorans TaxID=409370 RepID=A0A060THM3_BLAAD